MADLASMWALNPWVGTARKHAAILLVALVTACGVQPATSDPVRLATKIHNAAEAQDYATLSKYMADEFSYSFGMSPSRVDALARYRKQPELLDKMAKVLSRDCAYNKVGPDRYYVCPEIATNSQATYYGWRAGFRRNTKGAWEFSWFIAGD